MLSTKMACIEGQAIINNKAINNIEERISKIEKLVTALMEKMNDQ